MVGHGFILGFGFLSVLLGDSDSCMRWDGSDVRAAVDKRIRDNIFTQKKKKTTPEL